LVEAYLREFLKSEKELKKVEENKNREYVS
jgi:hypothetical protein